MHGFWAKELDGDARISDAHGNERPLPTVAELHTLAKEIESHKHLIWSDAKVSWPRRFKELVTCNDGN